MKALVIFSGGQDSTTCLAYAINRYDVVEAITFRYGQMHSVEVSQSILICDKLKIKQTLVDLSFLSTLVKSALINGGDVNKINEKGLPDSFVPNRNQLFITLAHAYAQNINADTIIGGMCQTDFSGYPDCRKVFIDQIIHASNLGSLSEIGMETPMMNLTKAETFKLAADEGCWDDVIELSHTCYNGVRDVLHEWGYGCNDCPACDERRKGFNEYINKFEIKK